MDRKESLYKRGLGFDLCMGIPFYLTFYKFSQVFGLFDHFNPNVMFDLFLRFLNKWKKLVHPPLCGIARKENQQERGLNRNCICSPPNVS